MAQLSHPYVTRGKTMALTRWTFVGKMCFLFNILSRFVIAFLPRGECLNFIAAVTICTDFGAPQNKICHYLHFFSFYFPWSNGTGWHVGQSRWTGYTEEFWQNMVHKEWIANNSSILAVRTQWIWTVWKSKKMWHWKMNPYRVGRYALSQYATGKEQKAITNSSRKNETIRPKQEQHSVVDVSGGESKIWCCKEQYCIGT